MAAIAKDHLRRMLEHQEKVEAEQQISNPKPADPQLRMPLIGEVRPLQPVPSKRPRSRKKTFTQPRLGD